MLVGCTMGTPTDNPPPPPSSLATWDTSQSDVFPDASAGDGILRITNNCTYLMSGDQVLVFLIWPEPTSWNEANQSIAFVGVRGEQMELRDGDRIRPGGMPVEGNLPMEDIPFVTPPDSACQTDSLFIVNGVVKDPV